MKTQIKKRRGVTITIENNDAQISIFRPASGELLFQKKFIVLYENAYGEYACYAYSKEEISKNYNIDLEKLEDIQ